MKQNGGDLTVRGMPSQGTTFGVYFVTQEEFAANTSVLEASLRRKRGGRERLLLCEDDTFQPFRA